MTESNPNTAEINVGERAGEFPLWAAKEALKAAESALAETDKSRESLTKTAASLIGWSLPLSVVFGGVVFAQTLTLPQKTAGAVGFLLTTAAVLKAFQALRIRDWANGGLAPSQWFWLIENPPPEASSLYITVERLKSLDNALHKNDKYIEICAKHVRHSWLLLLAMPVFAFVAALLAVLIF